MRRRIVNIVFTVLLSCVLLTLGVFVFSASYVRLWEAVQDFGKSVGFYFCEMFGIPHGIVP